MATVGPGDRRIPAEVIKHAARLARRHRPGTDMVVRGADTTKGSWSEPQERTEEDPDQTFRMENSLGARLQVRVGRWTRNAVTLTLRSDDELGLSNQSATYRTVIDLGGASTLYLIALRLKYLAEGTNNPALTPDTLDVEALTTLPEDDAWNKYVVLGTVLTSANGDIWQVSQWWTGDIKDNMAVPDGDNKAIDAATDTRSLQRHETGKWWVLWDFGTAGNAHKFLRRGSGGDLEYVFPNTVETSEDAANVSMVEVDYNVGTGLLRYRQRLVDVVKGVENIKAVGAWVDLVTIPGGLPSASGKLKYMPLTLTANGGPADWDWLRAHA